MEDRQSRKVQRILRAADILSILYYIAAPLSVASFVLVENWLGFLFLFICTLSGAASALLYNVAINNYKNGQQ